MPIPKDDRSTIAPHPLSAKQHGASGSMPPAAAVHIMVPQVTIDAGGVDEDASFNSMMGRVAPASFERLESMAPPPSDALAPDELLLLHADTDHA